MVLAIWDATTTRIQNAPFGHVAIASPAQSASFREVTGADCAFTRGHLRRMRLCVRWLRVCAGEEKRTLRKGAFWARTLTERRSLRPPRRAKCAFPSHHRPGGVGPNRPPACGALWKMAQLGKRARATPRQAAGGVAPGARKPRPGTWSHGKAQSGQRASLRARPGPGRGTIRLPVVGFGGAESSGSINL